VPLKHTALPRYRPPQDVLMNGSHAAAIERKV
jgi:hypothetical protein